MKTRRFKTSYRKNSSKLHQVIGDCLRTKDSPFSGYKIYQEYPVSRINPNYPNAAHKFDWVVLDLCLVIEVHGQQHYRAVTFGGISIEDAEEKLVAQKIRDREKMEAAIEVGFTYVEIPYTDVEMSTPASLYQRYLENLNDQPVVKKEKPADTEYKQTLKERAKEYRQAQHRRQKEWLKNHQQ